MFDSILAMSKQQRIRHKDICRTSDDIESFFDECQYVSGYLIFRMLLLKVGQLIFALKFFINLCNRYCLSFFCSLI
jgi:hypothetical protein